MGSWAAPRIESWAGCIVCSVVEDGHGFLAMMPRSAAHPVIGLAAAKSGCVGDGNRPLGRAIASVCVSSADSVEQLLRAPFHVEPGILLGLVPREPRDSLHEIKHALCGAQDYAEVFG